MIVFKCTQSRLSRFNAYEMGPGRDLLAEMKTAFEHKGLELCVSSHRAEHWFFMSHGKAFDSDIHEPLVCGDFYWPSMPEPDHQDLAGSPPNQEFLEDWLLGAASSWIVTALKCFISTGGFKRPPSNRI